MTKNLILIPPFMSDETFWSKQVEALEKHANIIIPETSNYETIQDLAGEIIKNAPDKFYLAGLSMGGYISLEIMRQLMASGDEKRVVKLALLSTSFRSDTDAIKQSRQEQMAAALDGQMDAIYAAVIPLLFHPKYQRDIDFLMPFYASVIKNGPEVFARQQMVNMSREDSTNLLSKIKCPTLIIGGRQDKLVPVKYNEMMHDLVPNSNMFLLDDCAHFTPMEQPELVNKVMKDWLVG